MEQSGLHLGDNVDVLRQQVPTASVDLVYLDPPFMSGGRYDHLGENQIRVFDDVWPWDDSAARALEVLRTEGTAEFVRTLEAMHMLLGPSPMLAYLVMMAPRLTELHRVLKPTGSMYLHCDSAACHYLKVLVDGIFGPENFLNHIVWLYGLGGSSRRYWPRKHDDLLWYSRSVGRHYFAPIMIPATSQRMKGQNKKAPDYWSIPSLNNMARERTGYPTQKPESLLERIVLSSSRPGELVLDPCCGSGTTLVVAERLRRRWIGIDSAPLAIATSRQRLAVLHTARPDR